MRKHRNMFIEVMCESIIPCWGDVKDTDVPLTNALPEPLGIENASTSLSTDQKVGVSILNLESLTLEGSILRKTQEFGV
jgi:hypothetical protein